MVSGIVVRLLAAGTGGALGFIHRIKAPAAGVAVDIAVVVVNEFLKVQKS